MLLEKYYPNLFSEIFFTNQFLGEASRRTTKEALCESLGITTFVDDSVEHIKAITSIGVRAFLFDTPWNQGVDIPGATRVMDWKALSAMIP